MDAVLRWALAVVLLALAGYHLRHLVRRTPLPAHPAARDVDVVHAVMGAAMAVLLVRDAGAGAEGLLAAAFLAATLWFGVRSLDPAYGRTSANLRQSLCCAAMTAMVAVPLLAPTGMAGMASMPPSASGHALLAGVLALQAGLVLWTGVELAGAGAARRRPDAHLGAQLATITGGACMVALML